MTSERYPTEEELKTIKEWDLHKKPILDLLDYIKQIWWMPDWGFIVRGKGRNFRFELHCGGWSGNEDIIEALQENFIFWSIWWQKTIRGGHWYFRNVNDEFKRGKRKCLKLV